MQWVMDRRLQGLFLFCFVISQSVSSRGASDASSPESPRRFVVVGGHDPAAVSNSAVDERPVREREIDGSFAAIARRGRGGGVCV